MKIISCLQIELDDSTGALVKLFSIFQNRNCKIHSCDILLSSGKYYITINLLDDECKIKTLKNQLEQCFYVINISPRSSIG